MKQLFISLVLLLGGLAIFVLGTPYHYTFPTNGELSYNLSLTAAFLIMKKAVGWIIMPPPFMPSLSLRQRNPCSTRGC